MERDPAINDAINAARKSRQEAAGGTAESFDPEGYLLAVVRGTEPADAVRVGAARALLPFLKARERAPVKGATPQQTQRTTQRDGEGQLLSEWETRAAGIRKKLGAT